MTDSKEDIVGQNFNVFLLNLIYINEKLTRKLREPVVHNICIFEEDSFSFATRELSRFKMANKKEPRIQGQTFIIVKLNRVRSYIYSLKNSLERGDLREADLASDR